jgi:hypothetical protein
MRHMTKVTIIGKPAAIGLAILALAAGYRAIQQDAESPDTMAPATSPATGVETHPSFLHGRITTTGGDSWEGRLRFGGDEEAFWGDYFNGVKDGNPWVAYVPADRLPAVREKIEIFGVEIGQHERRIDLGRPIMARFGDIAKIEARGRDLAVTLKSGTVVQLDRYAADDFADGLRIWSDGRDVVEMGERRVRSIELLATASNNAAIPSRLHGTVRTRRGDFTGFLQWNRKEGVGSDGLDGHADGTLLSVPFNTIRSIARESLESSRVTLLDGREIVLSGTREVAHGNAGMYVDDARYGRVLVSWDAFERVDFSTPAVAGSGPVYDDFPAGRALTGSVTTRAGRRLTGRLVYDLDESETTETLDAPAGGVDYTILFGLVASIVLPGGDHPAAARARVILHSGEQLELERTGDLDDWNAGMLIFVNGNERPEYVPWRDVQRVDLDRPPAMYPAVSASQTSTSTRIVTGPI